MSEQPERKRKKGRVSGGAGAAATGFLGLGLQQTVVKGIAKKGYKYPTPIQKKCIPLILQGRDVVAMARTGSGKTAAFLIPMLNMLREHDVTGTRGLIISPTRELALQTFTEFKSLARYTGLRATAILGGSSMETNFESMHANPDVIIATPGRLMHVLIEMERKLLNLKFFVVDEADRLFELGFYEQLKVIAGQISKTRQTLLFSATLPSAVTEFTRIGLNDPALIRLDKDQRLSEHLKTLFFYVRPIERIPLLLSLLIEKINSSEKTVVFLATKHYVEYVQELLTSLNIQSTYVFSALDQECRKLNVASFAKGQCPIMLVTDIAARGIDIPVLDNVINFNFPASPKLFVHRVGRVARAGKSGTAYSFVTPEELPYLVDVHLFLSRPLTLARPEHESSVDGVLGAAEKGGVSDYMDRLAKMQDVEGSNIHMLKEVAERSLIQYTKTCPSVGSESVRRAKALDLSGLHTHPFLRPRTHDHNEQDQFYQSLKNFRTKRTIFEINPAGNTSAYGVMQNTRKRFQHSIEGFKTKKQKLAAEEERKNQMKSDAYIPYSSVNHHFEEGLGISKFENDIRSMTLDVLGDEESQNRQIKNHKVWDKKKKKFVGEKDNEKKIKTESGAKINKSFKSDAYKKWLHRTKPSGTVIEDESSSQPAAAAGKKFSAFVAKSRGKTGKARDEVKTREQVAKYRKGKKKQQDFQKDRHMQRLKRQGKFSEGKKGGKMRAGRGNGKRD